MTIPIPWVVLEQASAALTKKLVGNHLVWDVLDEAAGVLLRAKSWKELAQRMSFVATLKQRLVQTILVYVAGLRKVVVMVAVRDLEAKEEG